MKDYNAAVEMKSIGVSATSQEMIEINKTSNMNEEKREKDVSKDDDFEVIPIPSCFDLEVPFELIDKENEEELNDKEDEEELVKQLSVFAKTDISVDSFKESE